MMVSAQIRIGVLVACILTVFGALGSAPALAAEAKHEHHIVFQVSEGDPARMNLTLNNVVNVAQEYGAKGDMFEIEVVTYGPGLTMLRDDKSPVQDRLK